MKLSEFEFINYIASRIKSGKGVIKGIGDDTAVVEFCGKFGLLTCDSLVGGTHFLESWVSLVPELFFFLGRKLVSVCVSDIASMGGAPLFSLITLGATPSVQLEKFYEGVESALCEYGLFLVGGDTVKSENPFFDFFILGESEKFPMLRENAKAGELVGVTGSFGDAKAGLEQLLSGKVKDRYLINRFLDPKARLREGREALRLGVKCAIDVSDGLVFSLYAIAESSNVRIEISSELIPLSNNLVSFCGTREKALDFALYGGEDYELVATFPEELQEKMEELGFKVIGRVMEGNGVYLDGRLLEKSGYDHFRGKE